MRTKSRLKLTIAAFLLLGVLAGLATYQQMEAVATTAIAGIMTILSAYIWAQTKRPSVNEKYYPNLPEPEPKNDRRIRIRSTIMPDGTLVPGTNQESEKRE
jgi:phage shock protein PspC (stress-responsive transcriptional regulator)